MRPRPSPWHSLGQDFRHVAHGNDDGSVLQDSQIDTTEAPYENAHEIKQAPTPPM